jgi:hypothetical protein
MKAIVHTVVTVGIGQGENVAIIIDMPFVPTTGMLIGVAPGGCRYSVESIQWVIDHPDQIDVFVNDDLVGLTLDEFVEDGWQLESSMISKGMLI